MESRATTDTVAPSLTLPGIVLGVGLGGFLDGILLHQLLQWHHMLTSIDSSRIHVGAYPADTVHGLQINTVWDGLFHTFTWLCVLIGLGLLYSRLTHSRVSRVGKRVIRRMAEFTAAIASRYGGTPSPLNSQSGRRLCSSYQSCTSVALAFSSMVRWALRAFTSSQNH